MDRAVVRCNPYDRVDDADLWVGSNSVGGTREQDIKVEHAFVMMRIYLSPVDTSRSSSDGYSFGEFDTKEIGCLMDYVDVSMSYSCAFRTIHAKPSRWNR